MAEHSKIMGGSSAERRINCTGSAALEAQMPPRQKTEWSMQGDALHAVMYRALDEGEHVIGERESYTDEDGDTILIGKDDLEARFWPAYSAIRALMAKWKVGEYDLELRHDHHKTAGADVFGTLDFVGRGTGPDGEPRVVIADFKFGQGVREHAKESFQLAHYATGLMDNDDPMMEGVSKLVFAVIQPWRGATDPDTITDEWETDTLWLDLYRSLERRSYLRIVNNQTSLKSGQWCQFCSARPICPEQNQNLEVFVRDADAAENQRSHLSTTKLAELLDKGARAVKQYEALVAHATQLAVSGENIPEHKLIESVGHRTWGDPAEAEATLVPKLGSEAYEPRKLRSPAQIEKAAKRLKVSVDIDGHVVRPSRGPRLVKDDHPGKTYKASTDVDMPFNVEPIKRKEKKQ